MYMLEVVENEQSIRRHRCVKKKSTRLPKASIVMSTLPYIRPLPVFNI